MYWNNGLFVVREQHLFFSWYCVQVLTSGSRFILLQFGCRLSVYPNPYCFFAMSCKLSHFALVLIKLWMWLLFIPDCKRCCYHGSSLLQWLTATSNERCRNDRWPQCSSNHQRTDGCCHCLRPRQKSGQRAKRFNFRPWWWHLWCVNLVDWGRNIWGEVNLRWYAPWWRGLWQ